MKGQGYVAVNQSGINFLKNPKNRMNPDQFEIFDPADLVYPANEYG